MVQFTTDQLVEAEDLNQMGYEVARQTLISNVNVTATVEASANTIVTLPAKTYLATPHLIEVFFCRLDAGSGSAHMQILLFDGSTSLGWLTSVGGGTQQPGFKAEHLLTPTAASHTYSVRGVLSASGTGIVRAGSGGAGTYLPGFIRISRLFT
jgi:hypothetical protein